MIRIIDPKFDNDPKFQRELRKSNLAIAGVLAAAGAAGVVIAWLMLTDHLGALFAIFAINCLLLLPSIGKSKETI